MRAKIVYFSSFLETAESVDMIYFCFMRKLHFFTLNYAKEHFFLFIWSYVRRQVDREHILIYSKTCGRICNGRSETHTHTHTWNSAAAAAAQRQYCMSSCWGEVMLPCSSSSLPRSHKFRFLLHFKYIRLHTHVYALSYLLCQSQHRPHPHWPHELQEREVAGVGVGDRHPALPEGSAETVLMPALNHFDLFSENIS